MARYLIILLFVSFIGCEINGEQFIKPEKFKYDEVKFDAVTKKLKFEEFNISKNDKKITQIIEYWFDNKIKTDGFDGDLNVTVKKIDIERIKEDKYYKFTLDLIIQFKVQSDNDLKRVKIHSVGSKEFGEITGSFSINDQENLDLNLMHQSLKNISKKLLQII